MFAIYGISGPIFQGTLENLSRLQPVLRRSPPPPVRRVGAEVEGDVLTGKPIPTTTAGINTEAIKAYQSALPQELERGPLYHADQIMQRQVITVRASDDVARAWRVLVEHQIHQAPVLDATGRLVGIVGERDLLTTFNIDDGQLRDVLFKRVSDVMSTPVVAAAPITDIRRIAGVRLDREVDGVPVVNDSGALLGFISRSDILKAVITDPPLSIWR